MKKAITIVLTVGLILILSACNVQGDNTSENPQSDQSEFIAINGTLTHVAELEEGVFSVIIDYVDTITEQSDRLNFVVNQYTFVLTDSELEVGMEVVIYYKAFSPTSEPQTGGASRAYALVSQALSDGFEFPTPDLP